MKIPSIILVFLCGGVIDKGFLLDLKGLSYRLPTTVQPLFYKIKLAPDIDQETFKGELSVTVNVKSLVSSITLHSSNLTITEIYLDQSARNVQYSLEPAREFLNIFYVNGSQITPGNHVIYVKYDGHLIEDGLGFIKAKMVYEDKVSFLAVTDFQPTYARRAFPCFDEPALKARFQVTLVAPNSTYTSLSNMRQMTTFTTSQGVVTTFETSCVMSTYLLAFAVSPFTYGEYWLDNGCQKIPIRAYSINASNENNLQPLEFVAKSIEFFSNYTKFPYPLSKIDLIEYKRAQSVATENWGLITAKMGILSPNLELYHPSQVVAVISHEVAHFWFGNLVTNNWWDDIWLHEGFAVFMSLKAEDHFTNYSASKNFPSQYLEDVYLMDQQQPTGAVVHSVESPQDIESHFSDITYAKGAAILRMIENVLGKGKFHTVLRHYIRKFAYKTATTNDLINLIQDAKPDVDMRSFVESFVYQNRYPLIQIEDSDNGYILKQISCAYKKDDRETQFRYKWTIPVTYITEVDKSEKLVWFHRDMEQLEIPRGPERWIKLNYNQIGFYRTVYGDKLWSQLLENHEEIDISEKTHLLSEAVQLYLADIIHCSVAIKCMEQFSTIKKGLPLTPAYVFLVYATEEIKKYDETAFSILENHIKGLMRKSADSHTAKSKRKIKRTASDLDTNEKNQTVPDRIKSCAQWIKLNLSQPNAALNSVK